MECVKLGPKKNKKTVVFYSSIEHGYKIRNKKQSQVISDVIEIKAMIKFLIFL